MPEWLIPALSGVFGAIVGGGGATYVVRLALTESMRQTFAVKEDVVSRLHMHEEFEDHRGTQEARLQEVVKQMRDEFRAFLVEVRQEFEAKFTPTAARIEREHSALRADLDRAIGELRFATQQVQNEGKNGKEAYAESRLAVEKVEGLQRLFEALTARVGRMEQDIKIVGEIRESVDALKEQLTDVLNYQIAEERRRTKERGL